MGVQETHIGKLQEVRVNNIEEFAKGIMGNDLPESYSTYTEWLVFERRFILINDKLYQIIKDEIIEGNDVFDAIPNKDDTIDFVLSFYNGGMGFEEALEEALKGIE